MAQLVKDFRSRTETAGFSRCPRCRQRGVQRSTFLVSQVVPCLAQVVDLLSQVAIWFQRLNPTADTSGARW